MKNTPIAAIIVTYTCENASDIFPIIRKSVRTLNSRKITTNPTIGRSARTIAILDAFLSCCSLSFVFALTCTSHSCLLIPSSKSDHFHPVLITFKFSTDFPSFIIMIRSLIPISSINSSEIMMMDLPFFLIWFIN